MRQSQKMNNPEKLATLSTQDAGRRQKKHKNKKQKQKPHHYAQLNASNVNRT